MTNSATNSDVSLTSGTGETGQGPGDNAHQSTVLRLLSRVLPPIAVTEAGSSYDGVLSTFEEYHAIYVGFLAAQASPAVREQFVQTALMGYSAGRGGKKAALSDDPHIHDAVDEPAYAAFGMMLGMGAKGVQLGTLQGLL